MPVELGYEPLREEVERRSGMRLAPPSRFRDGLEILVADVEADGRLSREGRRLLQHELLRVMTQRAWFDKIRALNPVRLRPTEILVITGLPRTKSTLLHNLLAELGVHDWIPYWRALEPFPLSDDPTEVEERIGRAGLQLKFMRALSPDLLRVHPMREDRPEECITLMQMTGRSDRFAISLTAPTYREWMQDFNVATESYAEYFEMLELMYGGKPLVLKAPSHAVDIAYLQAAAPTAEILWLTRPLSEVERSFERLVVASRAVFESSPSAVDWRGAWAGLRPPASAVEIRSDQVEAFAQAKADALGVKGAHAGDFAHWLAPTGP